jgi:hypothetical protein
VKVSRRHGRLQLRLDTVEVGLLQSLLDELTSVLSGADDDDDEVTRRLFPAGYRDDEGAETDFRSLTREALRSDRLDRIALCAGELDRAPDIDLSDPDTGQRWIQVLNDLRLALGTRLGVREDDPPVDPDDPQAQPRLIYHWLTAVQDSVVTGLMR